MKNDKEHLDIDLEFLDRKEASKAVPACDTASTQGHSSSATTSNTVSSGYQYNWKNILIIGGIIFFFGWAIFSDSGSSSTPSSDSNDLFTDGSQTFHCSDSNYDRAMQLKPSVSRGAQLATESDSLDARIAANKAEKDSLDGMYFDENDQYSVDNYNSRVDDYNTERQRLITAVDSWTQRNDAFNSQIDTYNNFLDANCTTQ